jgi:hypothetical protein
MLTLAMPRAGWASEAHMLLTEKTNLRLPRIGLPCECCLIRIILYWQWLPSVLDLDNTRSLAVILISPRCVAPLTLSFSTKRAYSSIRMATLRQQGICFFLLFDLLELFPRTQMPHLRVTNRRAQSRSWRNACGNQQWSISRMPNAGLGTLYVHVYFITFIAPTKNHDYT